MKTDLKFLNIFKNIKSLHSCKYSKSCGCNLLNGDLSSTQNLYLWCRCSVFTVNVLTGTPVYGGIKIIFIFRSTSVH